MKPERRAGHVALTRVGGERFRRDTEHPRRLFERQVRRIEHCSMSHRCPRCMVSIAAAKSSTARLACCSPCFTGQPSRATRSAVVIGSPADSLRPSRAVTRLLSGFQKRDQTPLCRLELLPPKALEQAWDLRQDHQRGVWRTRSSSSDALASSVARALSGQPDHASPLEPVCP